MAASRKHEIIQFSKGGRLTWRGGQVFARVKKYEEAQMREAARVAFNHLRKLIGRSNKSGDKPSLPGEPPKRVTGRLRRNVRSAVIVGALDVQARVGFTPSSSGVALRLEQGFTTTLSHGRVYRLAPRPHLLRSVHDKRNEIGRILAGRGAIGHGLVSGIAAGID